MIRFAAAAQQTELRRAALAQRPTSLSVDGGPRSYRETLQAIRVMLHGQPTRATPRRTAIPRVSL